MKSAARVLRQWATDEITFSVGGKLYHWTREELERFIELNFLSKPHVEVRMPDGKILPVVVASIVDVHIKLKWKKYRHLREPRNFARFFSLDELAKHLEVEV